MEVRVWTYSVGTMTGKLRKMTEMMERRKVEDEVEEKQVWSWKLNGVMFNVVTAYTPEVGCQKRKMNYGVSWMKKRMVEVTELRRLGQGR